MKAGVFNNVVVNNVIAQSHHDDAISCSILNQVVVANTSGARANLNPITMNASFVDDAKILNYIGVDTCSFCSSAQLNTVPTSILHNISINSYVMNFMR
jgi:hypothetical protein